jgi:hypothetical protein
VAGGVGGVDVAELLEDPRPRLGRHARAGVVDDEGQHRLRGRPPVAPDRQMHAPGLGELDRVPGQIAQHLTQAAFVGHDGG